MIQVEIQRDAVAKEMTLFLQNGDLHTRSLDLTTAAVVKFELQVFPNLAMADKDESDPERDLLYFGTLSLGDRLLIGGGLSEDYFRSWRTKDGWLHAGPTNILTVHLQAVDADAAVVRLIAETGREARLPAHADSVDHEPLPAITWMWGPRPNPARQGVTFRFSVSHRLPAHLVVFDVQGRKVATLVDRAVDPGPHEFTWDRSDSRGNHSKSGIYFARFEADGLSFTKRFVLVR